jgi:transposase-like protein
MARVNRAQQKAIWRERVAEWERSGQSVSAFCRQHRLGTWSLYQWRKRLMAAPAQPPKRTTRFVEISLPPAGVGAWSCELELKNGRKLRFQGGVPAQRLAELASALEGGAC